MSVRNYEIGYLNKNPSVLSKHSKLGKGDQSSASSKTSNSLLGGLTSKSKANKNWQKKPPNKQISELKEEEEDEDN